MPPIPTGPVASKSSSSHIGATYSIVSAASAVSAAKPVHDGTSGRPSSNSGRHSGRHAGRKANRSYLRFDSPEGLKLPHGLRSQRDRPHKEHRRSHSRESVRPQRANLFGARTWRPQPVARHLLIPPPRLPPRLLLPPRFSASHPIAGTWVDLQLRDCLSSLVKQARTRGRYHAYSQAVQQQAKGS